ncbi:BrnA antitoxin family protein [Nocardiopsis alborubida]|uniref:BrnA antitoxin family protein n=1 Tax=Nocardiopsis alborubida TaxID=146802 RepID=UPI000ADFBF93|nr:BrnA antitoxin family protein [Nocardiopsis alborubida]
MDNRQLDELAEYYGEHDISEDIEAAELERHDPEPGDRVMVVSPIRLPKHTMNRVREVAAARDVKPTALMRRWIEEHLELEGRTAQPDPGHLDLLSQVMRRVVREEPEDAGLRGN